MMMVRFMHKILSTLQIVLSHEELENIVKLLVSSYNPYDLQTNAWGTLLRIFPLSCHDYINEFQKEYIPNEVYNSVIFHYYKGENIVKYNLAMQNLDHGDEVSIFEANVNSSRLDFSRINGESHAYEIKTELDTTDRLEKQICDYEKVFEKLYVVIHPSHYKKVKQLVPRKCGIITYQIKSGECFFCEDRKAQINNKISKESQIQNLNSQDYAFILKQLGIDNIPAYKAERENLIRIKCKKSDMNELFKLAMKNKNKEKWEYVKNHIDILLPIDIQDFFTNMPNPNHFYYRISSIERM
jgi:hypothetical protein